MILPIISHKFMESFDKLILNLTKLCQGCDGALTSQAEFIKTVLREESGPKIKLELNLKAVSLKTWW